MILTLSDFKGEYEIAINDQNRAKVEAIIEQREPKILRGLLGNVDYKALIGSDLVKTTGGTVATNEQTYIYNPFYWEPPYMSGYYESEGLKAMLAKLIYFYINRDAYVNNSILGDRNAVSEVSLGINSIKSVILYNDGVRTYNSILHYCRLNSDLYPTWSGLQMRTTGII